MPFRALGPDDFRLHQFIKIGRTDRTSFVVRCTGCGWESHRCWDEEDMTRAKARHLEKLDRAKWDKLQLARDRKRKYGRRDPNYIPARRDVASTSRSARRRATKKARRSDDGQTEEGTAEGRTEAEAGKRQAVQGGGRVRETQRSSQPERGGSRGRSEEVRQETDGQDGRQGSQAGRRPKEARRSQKAAVT